MTSPFTPPDIPSSGGADVWYVPIDPLVKPPTNTGWADTYQGEAGAPGQLFWTFAISTGTQNDGATWPVVLSAGTWTLQFVHAPGGNRGIYTFAFDGTTFGTIDGYNAGSVPQTQGSVAGIAVASSSKMAFSITMATKNAASSAYYALVGSIQFIRTA